MLCRYLVMRDAISSIIQRERQISRLPTYPPLVTYHTLQHLFVLCLLSCFCFQSLSEKKCTYLFYFFELGPVGFYFLFQCSDLTLSNLQELFSITRTIFLTVGQNNFQKKIQVQIHSYNFSNFSCMFLNPNNLNFNCSNLLDMLEKHSVPKYSSDLSLNLNKFFQ